MNITLCNSICHHLNLSNLLCNRPRSNHKKISKAPKHVRVVLQDINALLEDPDFDRNFICNHILNKLIQITGSEYGFIGKIHPTYLDVYATTNIAWNASSQDFFRQHIGSELKFDVMDSHYGEVMTTGKPLIVNKYDNNRNVLPPGHPMIKRFLGVPSCFGDRPIVMIGLCNKLGKYTKRDVKNVQLVLDIVSLLFVEV